MICICKTSNILSIDWLEQCAKEQSVLETDDFLLLNDKAAEESYNFSMKSTLENGKRARDESGGVLGGWYLYICRGVAGKNAPSSKEFSLLIEATGATLLRKLVGVPNPAKTIVITSDPITEAQRSEAGVEDVIRQGARSFTTTRLFHTIITQKLCFDGTQSTHSGRLGNMPNEAKCSAESGGVTRKSRSRNR